jgi:hypothetical protein
MDDAEMVQRVKHPVGVVSRMEEKVYDVPQRRGSEANVPLGRAVIGGLLAGLLTTLFVVPSLYALVVRGNPPPLDEPLPGEPGWSPQEPHGATPAGAGPLEVRPAEGEEGIMPA